MTARCSKLRGSIYFPVCIPSGDFSDGLQAHNPEESTDGRLGPCIGHLIRGRDSHLQGRTALPRGRAVRFPEATLSPEPGADPGHHIIEVQHLLVSSLECLPPPMGFCGPQGIDIGLSLSRAQTGNHIVRIDARYRAALHLHRTAVRLRIDRAFRFLLCVDHAVEQRGSEVFAHRYRQTHQEGDELIQAG